jgi:hypothetical protein
MVGILVFENKGLHDRIRITVKDKYGNIKSDHYVNEGLKHRFLVWLKLRHNSMTNVGFADVAGLTIDVGSVTAFSVIGIGTGTQADDPTDTKLAEADGVALKLKTATTKTRINSDGITNNTCEWIVTFSSADGGGCTGIVNVTEVGIFNGLTNGVSDMLLHKVYTPADVVNFTQGDSITVTVTEQNKQGS